MFRCRLWLLWWLYSVFVAFDVADEDDTVFTPAVSFINDAGVFNVIVTVVDFSVAVAVAAKIVVLLLVGLNFFLFLRLQ